MVKVMVVSELFVCLEGAGNNADGSSDNLAEGVLALIMECLAPFVKSHGADFNKLLKVKEAHN